jgi:hypothetical protein
MNEDFVVTKPQCRKIDGAIRLLPGTGVVPPDVRDRIFLNVMFMRLLETIRAKAKCSEIDYDPVVQSTAKSKTTGEAYHFVGGESFYDELINRDLAHLRGVWAGLGINGPDEDELLEMAGVK